jgi:hypothetical protein
MTDDQFHDLMRMLRLILVALAVIAGLLGGFPAKRIDELLPWNWRRQSIAAEVA